MIIFSNPSWLSGITIAHANYTLQGVNKSVFRETHMTIYSVKQVGICFFKSDEQLDKAFYIEIHDFELWNKGTRRFIS